MDSSLDYNLVNALRCYDKEIKDKNCQKSGIVLFITIVIFLILIIIGIIGFIGLFDLYWLDALYVATLVLTGINVETNAISESQKWFIIIYSIFSIVIYLSLAGAALNYIVMSF